MLETWIGKLRRRLQSELVFGAFVSAVSSEFKSDRSAVASDLRGRDFIVKVQEDFRQELDADTTLQKLSDYIEGCAAIVCILGKRSGSCPTRSEAAPFADRLPEGFDRLSYTQWELVFARHFGKRLSIHIANDDHVADRDEPADDAGLQREFREHVTAGLGLDRSYFSTTSELCLAISREDGPSDWKRQWEADWRASRTPFRLGGLVPRASRQTVMVTLALLAAVTATAALLVRWDTPHPRNVTYPDYEKLENPVPVYSIEGTEVVMVWGDLLAKRGEAGFVEASAMAISTKIDLDAPHKPLSVDNLIWLKQCKTVNGKQCATDYQAKRYRLHAGRDPSDDRPFWVPMLKSKCLDWPANEAEGRRPLYFVAGVEVKSADAPQPEEIADIVEGGTAELCGKTTSIDSITLV